MSAEQADSQAFPQREMRDHSGNVRSARAQDRAQSRDHLYVLQSADGLIKVGRSKHPRTRASNLSVQRRCHVVLVGRFPREGYRERAVLAALEGHRAFGEWFHDTPELRAAVLTLLGEGVKFRDKMPRRQRQLRRVRANPDEAIAAWITKENARLERRRRLS